MYFIYLTTISAILNVIASSNTRMAVNLAKEIDADLVMASDPEILLSGSYRL